MTGIKPPPAKKARTLDIAPVATVAPLTKREDGALTPINFKVSPEFKRLFKTYAASKDESMVEVLIRAVTREMENNP